MTSKGMLEEMKKARTIHTQKNDPKKIFPQKQTMDQAIRSNAKKQLKPTPADKQ